MDPNYGGCEPFVLAGRNFNDPPSWTYSPLTPPDLSLLSSQGVLPLLILYSVLRDFFWVPFSFAFSGLNLLCFFHALKVISTPGTTPLFDRLLHGMMVCPLGMRPFLSFLGHGTLSRACPKRNPLFSRSLSIFMNYRILSLNAYAIFCFA